MTVPICLLLKGREYILDLWEPIPKNPGQAKPLKRGKTFVVQKWRKKTYIEPSLLLYLGSERIRKTSSSHLSLNTKHPLVNTVNQKPSVVLNKNLVPGCTSDSLLVSKENIKKLQTMKPKSQSYQNRTPTINSAYPKVYTDLSEVESILSYKSSPASTKRCHIKKVLSMMDNPQKNTKPRFSVGKPNTYLRPIKMKNILRGQSSPCPEAAMSSKLRHRSSQEMLVSGGLLTRRFREQAVKIFPPRKAALPPILIPPRLVKPTLLRKNTFVVQPKIAAEFKLPPLSHHTAKDERLPNVVGPHQAEYVSNTPHSPRRSDVWKDSPPWIGISDQLQTMISFLQDKQKAIS